MIEFFITNLVPPTEQDQFTFQCIDEKKRLYLGSTNFGKEAQLYLHHDNQNHILHMMPFTFSNFSVDRLLVYLANQESYSYFGKHLPKKLVEKAILLYSINRRCANCSVGLFKRNSFLSVHRGQSIPTRTAISLSTLRNGNRERTLVKRSVFIIRLR